MNFRDLVTSSPRLGNHTLQLIDLRLGTTESTELSPTVRLLLNDHHLPEEEQEKGNTYPLLGQLAGTLILAVSEQFDDTALIWGKTTQRK